MAPVVKALQARDDVGYLEFVALMTRATFVLTDSGWVQEEAPSIGKPVLWVDESRLDLWIVE